MTSPPFALVRKKAYGNPDGDWYNEWFKSFGMEFRRVLKDSGSLVIDAGGAWQKGSPTKSLYNFKMLLVLCEQVGFHLAHDYYWWNPAKLPSPSEWVTVRRIRVKDGVNPVWWLSKTEWPKASNRRVLQPYSESHIKGRDGSVGRDAEKRPSGHLVNPSIFEGDNSGPIGSNMLAMSNAESNGRYLKYCKERGLKPHPARFPVELPEYFVRMLTDRGDMVVDPFGGSCVTGGGIREAWSQVGKFRGGVSERRLVKLENMSAVGAIVSGLQVEMLNQVVLMNREGEARDMLLSCEGASHRDCREEMELWVAGGPYTGGGAEPRGRGIAWQFGRAR